MWKLFGSKKQTTAPPPSESKKVVEANEGTTQKVPQKRGVPRHTHASSWSIILGPWVTEKSTNLAATRHTVVVRVSPKATKQHIRRAFEDLYGVNPVGVNVIVLPERRTTRGRKVFVHRVGKKAIITLPEGAIVDVTQPPIA